MRRQEAQQTPPFPSLGWKPEGEDPTQKAFVPDPRHFQLSCVLEKATHKEVNTDIARGPQCGSGALLVLMGWLLLIKATLGHTRPHLTPPNFPIKEGIAVEFDIF